MSPNPKGGGDVKFQEREIAGHRFIVGMLPTMRGWKLLNRIARIIMPAMASIAPAAAAFKKGGVTNVLDMDVKELGDLGPAVAGIFDRMGEDEQEYITRALLENAVVIVGGAQMPLFGMGGQFDIVLQGQMASVAALVKFAFEVNFGDFSKAFALIAKLASGAEAAKEAAPR